MDESMSVLIQIPFNKLVFKKRYMIETNGSVFIGTFYYMFGPTDIIGDMFGLGQSCFTDFKPILKTNQCLYALHMINFMI